MKRNKDVVGKFINDMIVGGLVTLAFCAGVKYAEKRGTRKIQRLL